MMRSYRESMDRIAMPDALKERIRQRAALLENRPAVGGPMPQGLPVAGMGRAAKANGQTLPGRAAHRRGRWIWLAAQGAAACLLCLLAMQMQLSDWLLPAEKSTTQESSAGTQQASAGTGAAKQGSGIPQTVQPGSNASASPENAAGSISGAPPLQANEETPGFSFTLEPPHMDTAEPDAPQADNMQAADQDTPSRQQDNSSILDSPVTAPAQDSASQQQSAPSSQEQAQITPPTSIVPETVVPSPAPSFAPDSAADSESTSGGGGGAAMGGGGGGGAGGSTLVQGGSPFTEFASIDALQAACGFSFRYPRALPDGCALSGVLLAYGEQVQLTYQGSPAFTFWVSTSGGLPSGQGAPSQVEIAGKRVTVYLDGGAVYGAVWTDGSLHYAITCSGLPLEQVRALIAGVA